MARTGPSATGRSRRTSRAVALSVAGSDPCGAAGFQLDLRVFAALGVYASAIPACLTVQDTARVWRVEPVASDLVAAQLDAALQDLRPRVVKVGLLGSAAVAEAVAGRLASEEALALVLDPVADATSGDRLADGETLAEVARSLLPIATLVTPNLAEAARLVGGSVTTLAEMRRAARALCAAGASAALVKGGHLPGPPTDVLALESGELVEIEGERVEGPPVRGTGCALSAAIAAGLARGAGLLDAVRSAKAWLREEIRRATRIGRGPAVLLAGG